MSFFRFVLFSLLFSTFNTSASIYALREKLDSVVCGEVGDHVTTDFFIGCSTELGGQISSIRYKNGTLYAPYHKIFKAVLVSNCPVDTELNLDTHKCEPIDQCSEFIDSNTDVAWFSSIHGKEAGQYWCSTVGGGCSSEHVAASTFCGDVTGDVYDCIATYTITGPQCDFSGDEVGWCKDAECTEKLPPITPPEPPTPEPDPDTEHEPTDPTTPLPEPTPLPPITVPIPPTEGVDPKPEVSEPELTPDSNGDVVKAVTNLNRDVNKALNDLNIDINKANSELNGELMFLNANVKQNSEQIVKLREENIDIYDNTKALIQNLNKDVTSAVNRNTERIDGELERVGEKLDGIGTTLESMTNVDTSGAGVSATCIETDTCVSYYETKYPEGLSGMASTQLAELKTEVIDGFVASFGELDLSNAERPKFGLPVPFYGWLYFSDYVDMDWIFSFLRFCFMVTTVFMCRRIVFGG